jgi:thiol-disulfide isomerase/thioredoxin
MTRATCVVALVAALGCATTRVRTLAPAATSPVLPVLELSTLDGSRWTSATLAGQVAVLDVWAAYCKPCRKAFPVLDRLHAARPDVVVVGLSVDEDDAAVHQFLREVPASFLIVRDREQRARDAPLAIVAVPTLLLIDRAGRVRLRIANATAADYEALPALVDAIRAER